RIETFVGGADDYRGRSGPLSVTFSGFKSRLTDAFVEASQQAGLPFNPDFNAQRQEGGSDAQLSLKRGFRHSAAPACPHPARGRKNLRLETHAVATRILIEGDRASGVEYCKAGETVSVRARREVLVSAGAIESPKLLMLSGIGPAEQLCHHGIDSVVDSPG